MNILLITSSYPPEIRSSAHLMQELAEDLNDRGHNIAVITSYPQHNLIQDNIYKSFENVSNENGIKVIRIKTLPSHMVNYFVRGISHMVLPFVFLYNIKKYINQKIDIVIVYSPPLSLSLVGSILKKTSKAKFILNVQDIFPQNAIDLGILRNSLSIKIFEQIESNAYSTADHIMVHSEGNSSFLCNKKKVPQEKITTVYNWIDIAPYVNTNATGQFRKQLHLENKFVLLFAGVIGPSQGLDLLLEAADRLRHIPDICFLIVGDGMERKQLEKKAVNISLNNVIFRPFVSKEEYPKLVKDIDVGVVCLSNLNKTPVVPSKILGYMAASVSIVAFLNKESDGHKIIRDAECGYSMISDDPLKASELIYKLYKERCKLHQYGEKGFSFVSTNFTREMCIDKIERLFCQ
ncbi:MAG: glycosyltransferase family 4 protein [Nitrospirae bacterium]|nr:glycosyltransferase family 4 protein [Nitrospirota bacterium]